MPRSIRTVREHIAWSYGNLARAHAALEAGVSSYRREHHGIRARLYKGLCTGSMKMRSLYDDERLKMVHTQACCYCGSTDSLTVDHMIPRIAGGSDQADNLVWACRSCNSSKRDSDMLEWMTRKRVFPALFVLRRYIKLVAAYCSNNDLLEVDVAVALLMDLPFDLSLLPHRFPALGELRLWVGPASEYRE